MVLNAVTLRIVLAAKRVTPDQRFGLLDRSCIVERVSLALRVLGISEFRLAAGPVARTLEHAPRVFYQRRDVFTGVRLRENPHHFDTRNGFALVAGAIALAAAQ